MTRVALKSAHDSALSSNGRAVGWSGPCTGRIGGFYGTGGVSAGHRAWGFVPAFLDTATDRIYRAGFTDGRPAPMPLLEGWPPAVVAARDAAGRPIALQPTVRAGLVRDERFYPAATRP